MHTCVRERIQVQGSVYRCEGVYTGARECVQV